MTATIALSSFRQELRPYQADTVRDALEFARAVLASDTLTERQRRRCYSAPTGTGKGTIEMALLADLVTSGVDAWIVTPSLEVVRGFLERCGLDPQALEDSSADRLAELGASIHVTTPVRLRNQVLRGERAMPDVVIVDEAHHNTEGGDVSGLLFALAPLACWIGFTATPYRGTTKETQEFERTWNEIVEVMTIPEAVEGGYWALPTFEVVGLVDDDKIRLTGGDFEVQASGKAVGSRVEELAELVAQRMDRDRIPTVVLVPSREAAGLVVEALDRHGVPARLVTAETPATARALAYRECREGSSVLVSVRVVSEGVDFPWLGRIVDARPTMSPVLFVQALGRLTRPKSYRPEYICVCRNLERHSWLLGGLVPRGVVAQSQAAFGPGGSKRGAGRAIGFEAVGRFKPIPLPLLGGVTGTMFVLYSTDRETGMTTEWAILLDPTSEHPIVATREVGANADGTRAYGSWRRAAMPNDLMGYGTSQHTGPLSEKMHAWWRRSAASRGLDPDAVISRRQFVALPLLFDIRASLLPGGAR